MKKITLIVCGIICVFGSYAQQGLENETPTYFSKGLQPPKTISAPFIGDGSLWYNLNKVAYYNGSTWQYLLTETLASTTYTPMARTITINGVAFDLSQNRVWSISGVSNLSLGTATSTTVPINNDNGTGFILPVAVSGSTAGLLSATGATVLGNTSGTNTGNQTLTASSTVAGQFQMSGSGGTITINSLLNSSFPDANATPISSGLFVNTHTTGSSNYQTTSGGGFSSYRSASTFVSAFQIDAGSDNVLRFRTGSGVSTWGSWDPFAGKTYVDTQDALKAPLASPTFTGITTATQYKLSALNTAPASATATGTLGEIRITATYIYICTATNTATNTWVRSPLATW